MAVVPGQVLAYIKSCFSAPLLYVFQQTIVYQLSLLKGGTIGTVTPTGPTIDQNDAFGWVHLATDVPSLLVLQAAVITQQGLLPAGQVMAAQQGYSWYPTDQHPGRAMMPQIKFPPKLPSPPPLV